MTNRSNPRTSAKPQPEGEPSVVSLDRRLQNVEQILLEMQACMLPKWTRYTAAGMFVGACIKVIIGHA